MAKNSSESTGQTPAATAREARLKAALKENLARRKAQARARGAGDETVGQDDTGHDT
jgi:hypothetical protein